MLGYMLPYLPQLRAGFHVGAAANLERGQISLRLWHAHTGLVWMLFVGMNRELEWLWLSSPHTLTPPTRTIMTSVAGGGREDEKP